MLSSVGRVQELMSIFYEVLKEHEALVQAALSDIIAYRERVHAPFLLAGVPGREFTASVVEKCRVKMVAFGLTLVSGVSGSSM